MPSSLLKLGGWPNPKQHPKQHRLFAIYTHHTTNRDHNDSNHHHQNHHRLNLIPKSLKFLTMTNLTIPL